MVRVVMIDLGGTLVGGSPLKVLSGVPEALAAIGGLVTPADEPVAVCLVSDFRPTPEEIEDAFAEYLQRLDDFGLRDHFEPVARRVTISAHTAAWKPDRLVFETALRRLGVPAQLGECLLITEDAGHVAAARALGMRGLQFGVDFTDWSEAPTLVAALVAGDEPG